MVIELDRKEISQAIKHYIENVLKKGKCSSEVSFEGKLKEVVIDGHEVLGKHEMAELQIVHSRVYMHEEVK